jgi:anti-anti-sigma regulatory factor
VAGRGSFQNSAGVKEFAAEMTRRGHREFIVDLGECELMDSTFLGTLAGIALKMGGDGSVRIVRANPRNRQVLKNLGLDRVLALEEEPSPVLPESAWTETSADAPPAKRETIIEAHESLVAANPENAVRFKDVLEFLKHDRAAGEGRP